MKSATRRDFYRREMIGIALFCGAILLLLSLLSYSADEVRFNQSSTNSCTNWIGPVGLYLAYYTFFLFGFAAYLMPILGLVIAGLAIWGGPFKAWPSFAYAGGLVIAGAGLLD